MKLLTIMYQMQFLPSEPAAATIVVGVCYTLANITNLATQQHCNAVDNCVCTNL